LRFISVSASLAHATAYILFSYLPAKYIAPVITSTRAFGRRGRVLAIHIFCYPGADISLFCLLDIIGNKRAAEVAERRRFVLAGGSISYLWALSKYSGGQGSRLEKKTSNTKGFLFVLG
jgi:hypothetical protein